MRMNVRRLVTGASSVGFLGVLLSTSTGCGMLGSLANPKVAWAIQDPAPMSVVVRRADATQATVTEVDRLLTATPTGENSEWLTHVAPDPKEAAADMAALKMDPMYSKSHARVIPAEVWIRTLPSVLSNGGDKPNLLSAIDQSLGEGYAEIMSKKLEIAGLSQQIEDEKAAAEANPADKKSHEEAISKLEKTRSERENDVEPLQKKFLASIKPAAAKLAPAQQAKLMPAVLNLTQALDDADIANSAAVVRYPLALKSIGDSIKEVVPAIAADVVEEKVGNRPSLGNLKADIALNGSSVSITLGGINPGDIGGLDVGEITKEVIARSTKWVLHATTLLGTINSTKERLNFEHDVLGEIMAGFTPPSTGTATLVIKMPAFDSPEVTGAVPSAHISLVSRAHAGVSQTKVTAGAPAAAAAAPAAPEPAAAPAPAKKDGKKPKKGK